MSYTVSEVRELIEAWEELRHDSRLWLLVRYADLSKAIRLMPPKEYQAVLLVGLIGLSIDDAGRHMGVARETMWRRYERGIEWLTKSLNGGL